MRVYGRIDHYDRRRSTAGPGRGLRAGWAANGCACASALDIVNWTATEAFHPADVINARNLDSDLENLEKLGEPMVALQLGPFEETIAVAAVHALRSKPLFPSPRSRLSFAARGQPAPAPA